jgi:hypothetical protein
MEGRWASNSSAIQADLRIEEQHNPYDRKVNGFQIRSALQNKKKDR